MSNTKICDSLRFTQQNICKNSSQQEPLCDEINRSLQQHDCPSCPSAKIREHNSSKPPPGCGIGIFVSVD